MNSFINFPLWFVIMYLIAIGEIFLKGENRITFERRLMKNIRSALNLLPDELLKFRNRYIITKEDITVNDLRRVFGIIYFAKCIKTDLDNINAAALSLIKNEKTFRISARKSISLKKSSVKINEDVGSYILSKKTDLKVDLSNSEIDINIEELGNKCYLYKASDVVRCLGGLPLGTGGFAHLIVNDNIKSTVAGFLAMQRGVVISLSRDLPLLHKFEYGFNLKTREEKDFDIIILDETFSDFKINNDKKFTLRPLIGYSDEEINDIYRMIESI